MNDKVNAMTFSIEKEREEYHLRKRKRKMVKLYISLVMWALIIAFLCTPFASYRAMSVNGNVYLSEEEIINYAGIKYSWWWVIDSDKVRKKLEEHENIDNVSVSFDWKGLHISILERYPLASLVIGENEYYITNTGFDPVLKSECHFYENSVIDISDLPESKRNEFIRKYSNVSLNVRDVFYGLETTEKDDVLILKGKINENAYFNMEIKLEYIDVKLREEKFNNIKEEILGKINDSNVEYDIDNPVSVKYNFTDTNYYEIV